MRGPLTLAVILHMRVTFHLLQELVPPEFATHPSSGFATFSPRKARGEKALDARVWRGEKVGTVVKKRAMTKFILHPSSFIL
jgi:type VI protein secretion system component VasA